MASLQLLRELGKRLGVSAEYLATGGQAEPSIDDVLLQAELTARTGDLAGARKLYRALRKDAPSAAIEAAAQAGLGQIAFRSGDHQGAIDDLRAALESPALPPRDRVTAADSLGRCYAATARYEEALALFEESLRQAVERQSPAEVIRFSVLLSNLLIDRGSFGRAEEVLAGVLASARDAVDPVARAGLFWSQSRLHSSQGRPDLAAEYAREALKTLEVSEHTVYTAKALVLLAQLENERGNAGDALALFEQALPSIAGSGNSYEHGMLLLEKARSLSMFGDLDDAIGTALAAVGVIGDSSPVTSGRAYALAADLSARLGSDERAIELYELAIEVLPSHDRHRVAALTALASLLEEQGKKDRALALLKEALQAAPVSAPVTDT